MTTNHTAQALSLVDRANHFSYGDGGDPATGTALATEGLVHAVLALAEQLGQPAAAPTQVDVVLYQAVFESIPLGLYTNRAAARTHCEHDATSNGPARGQTDFGDLSWVREADTDQEEELHGTSPLGHTFGTDYWVNIVTAQAAFDPNAEG